MTSQELRQKYLEFFKTKGHRVISSASLMPENDPTVLFTTAGMHPLVPYLLGEKHPEGTRLTNVQKCIRTQDIDEVGDRMHHTFFEMLGNWSLGDYFKKEAIEMSFEFLTSKEKGLGLNINKLAVSVFAGDNDTPDEEAFQTWKSLGVPEKRIAKLPKKDNWWGPAGQTGPCGPDTEMFYWVDDKEPAPNNFQETCKDERWVEIWNDVFMEYNKNTDGTFSPLKQKNVDTGMGLERTLAVLNGLDDNYKTELFEPIIQKIEEISGKKYGENKEETKSMRIIADHLRAATMIMGDGRNIKPSNVEHGYIVRRLIRRAIRHGHFLNIKNNFCASIAEVVIDIFKDVYPETLRNKNFILSEIEKEENLFRKTLEKGMKVFQDIQEKVQRVIQFIEKNPLSLNLSLLSLTEDISKIYLIYEPFKKLFEFYNKSIKPYKDPLIPLGQRQDYRIEESKENREFIKKEVDYILDNIIINGKTVFHLYDTNGFPLEMTKELAAENGWKVDVEGFKKAFEEHQALSRQGSEQKFKGGLADNSEQTTKLHTATHLLHQALRIVLGTHVQQKGSNITAERLRFDFSHPEKMTAEQLQKVENLVNEQITKALPITCHEMTVEEAKKSGALGFFEHKYGEKVKVYSLDDFSKEICGGPHVQNTKELGHFKILKEEASSAGVRRIKATVE